MQENWGFQSSLWYEDYPFIPISPPHKAFYLLQLSVYVHLLISQFFDIKRKDFVEMFFHHVTAIVLIVVSYLSNFVRIGAIVLVLHDISDVFLESAKLAKYSKCGKAGDFLFALFALSFFVFRLVIFPLHVIKSAMFDASHLSKETNMRILFVAFLLVLFGLHLFWFSLIMKMVIQVYRGEMNKDIRSDSELEETIEKLD